MHTGNQSPERIAVIGSGMAGLAAARLCQDGGHHVTVFEAQNARGMDAHALQIDGGVVDVPLRVMSPQAWQSVLGLARHVGVETFGVDTFVSCNGFDGHTWFRSGRMPVTNWPWVGSARYLTPRALAMVRGFLHLRAALRRLEKENDERLLLGDIVRRENFDPLFWRGLVLPMLTTICTCREEHLLAWPALPLLRLLDTVVHGGQLQRLKGGTAALVDGLADGLSFHCGSAVVEVRQQADGVMVRNAPGAVAGGTNSGDFSGALAGAVVEGMLFDRVIVATAANQTGFLAGDQFAREIAVLGAMRFDAGELLVHRDTRFLPKRRSDWSALNYFVRDDLSASMFTVWVNAVEPTLVKAPPVFQTWNPEFEPDASQVIARIPLARAVVHGGSASALAALKKLHEETDRRVFFCGSWAYPGVPLLESAVRSAVAVGKCLRIEAPWCPSA